MMEYIVGANDPRQSNNLEPEKNRLTQAFLIFILLILIAGFGVSAFFTADAWLKGKLCKNKSDLPLIMLSLILYFQGIVWFARYPFMEFESIRKLYQ